MCQFRFESKKFEDLIKSPKDLLDTLNRIENDAEACFTIEQIMKMADISDREKETRIKIMLKVLSLNPSIEPINIKQPVNCLSQKGILFDSNCIDALLELHISLDEVFDLTKELCKYYITSKQVEEIAQTPDIDRKTHEDKREKRRKLFASIFSLHMEMLDDPLVLGEGRLGYATLADEETAKYAKKLQGNSVQDIQDAIIGTTANKKKLIIVTNDTGFIKKLCGIHAKAMTFSAWKEIFLENQ